MSNKIPKGTQNPQTKGQIPPNIRRQGSPPQGIPLQPIPRRLINPFNARGKNANVTQSDPRKQMSEAIRNMAANIKSLQKENAELKAKLQQKSQP